MIVLRLLYDAIKKADKNFNRDSRMAYLPLLGSPWSMVTVLVIYLLLVKRWGPQFMEHRKPFNVQMPMQIYNAMQVLLNLYVCYASFRYSYWQPGFILSCQAYNTSDFRPATMALRFPAYVYYITKYLDLLDTIFFLMRKKHSQITFLHVYHHSLMVYAVYTYNTLLFASHFTLTGVINSFVHVCMYTYYFVAAQKPSVNLLPWKRLLTQLQIAQFCYLSVHFLRPIVDNWCQLDLFWMWVAFGQNLFMLILFSDFYVKAYWMKERKAKLKATQLYVPAQTIKSQ